MCLYMCVKMVNDVSRTMKFISIAHAMKGGMNDVTELKFCSAIICSWKTLISCQVAVLLIIIWQATIILWMAFTCLLCNSCFSPSKTTTATFDPLSFPTNCCQMEIATLKFVHIFDFITNLVSCLLKLNGFASLHRTKAPSTPDWYARYIHHRLSMIIILSAL